MKLLSIIVVDKLTRRRMLTCGDYRTTLARSLINTPDMKVVDASEKFKIGRQWKDKRLACDTVKTYAAKTG